MKTSFFTLFAVMIAVLNLSPDLKSQSGWGGISKPGAIQKSGNTERKTAQQNPLTYDLGQNFPNPFNPTTTINYSVAEAGLVTIKAYNLIGKEMATIINEEKPAGNYSVKFDGSTLSSGVYFYTMKTGNFTQTRKFILMK